MPLNTALVGKSYDVVDYTIERDAVNRFVDAIGEEDPIYRDAEAAKAAGFRDLVAPPMFCVVYSGPALGPAILDPEVGINLPAMVHGGQEFEWGEPVCAGDVITTTARCKEIYEQDGRGFYVFESVSTNQVGEETVRATWTDIVRGVSA